MDAGEGGVDAGVLEGNNLEAARLALGALAAQLGDERFDAGEVIGAGGDDEAIGIAEDAGVGDGPVDAALKAIDRLTDTKGKLIDYSLRAVSQGKDALGEVTVKVDFGDKELVTGKGASTDIIEASARAYLNAVNRFLLAGNGHAKQIEHP